MIVRLSKVYLWAVAPRISFYINFFFFKKNFHKAQKFQSFSHKPNFVNTYTHFPKMEAKPKTLIDSGSLNQAGGGLFKKISYFS